MKKIALLVFVSVVLLSAMLPLTKESTSFYLPIIRLEPFVCDYFSCYYPSDVTVGDTFVINVTVTNVVDLSSFEFYLSYNTTVLDTSGVWVPPNFETPLPPQIIEPDGYIHVTANSTPPFSGNSTLASITFNATTVGSSILDLYDTTLFDSTGNPITHAVLPHGYVTVSSLIITVPDDYPTIQEAINAASDGDTIFVRADTYYENVVVNKTVSLIGENRSTTIIDGNMSGVSVSIWSSNVTVSGFTIRNGDDHGVAIYSSNSCVISNNIITNNQIDGVIILGNDNLITDNIIANNSQGINISLIAGGNNTISGNIIASNFYVGISIAYTSYDNKIFHNKFVNNPIQAGATGSNTWDDGYPSGGNYWSDYEERYPDAEEIDESGIWNIPYVINENNQDNYPLIHPYGSIRNLDTNLTYLTIQSAINAPETLDGHTIFVHSGIYYEDVAVTKTVSLIGEDKHNTIIDGYGIGVSANDVHIESFTVRRGIVGIWLGDCNSCTISGNIITLNKAPFYGHGILMGGGTHNTITKNVITENAEAGIAFTHLNCSTYDTIYANTISNNSHGITVFSSSNTIYANTISNNRWQGIALSAWPGTEGNNTIYHNNFINNRDQVFDDGTNFWDNGEGEGNYWSDYIGQDLNHDGIGDTHLPWQGVDNYPLMGMFSDFPVTHQEETHHVTTICNSTISDFQFNDTAKTISFNVTGRDYTLGFCRATIPNIIVQDFWQRNYTVLVDGKEPITMNNWTDGTYTYIYFTYLHSEHTVEIIPECPTWTSMLLLLIVLTVAIAIYKRKLLRTPIH